MTNIHTQHRPNMMIHSTQGIYTKRAYSMRNTHQARWPLHSTREGHYYTQHETTVALSDTEKEYISTTMPSRGISSRDNDTTSKDDDTTSNDDDTTSSDDDTTNNDDDTTSTDDDTTSNGDDTTSSDDGATSNGDETTSSNHDTRDTGV